MQSHTNDGGSPSPQKVEGGDTSTGEVAQPAPAAAQSTDGAEDSEDLNEFNSAPFFLLASKYFQRSSIWFLLVTGLCALRCASIFTVVLAYIHVLCRVFQTVALMFKKRPFAKAAYGLSTLIIFMMFFAAMVD